MGAVSDFFAHLYAMAILLFSLLFLETAILFRYLTGLNLNPQNRGITTSHYLKLIEETNPTLRFSGKLTPNPAECSVCLSEFVEGQKVRKLQCSHTFHKDCLDRWLKLYFATCPLCRTKVLPDDIVAGYRRLRDRVEYDGSDEELILLLSAFHGNNLHRLF